MEKQNIDKKKIRKYLTIIVVVIIAAIVIRTKLAYITPEFQGKIIDENTKEPIEKAVVTFIWMGYGKGLTTSNDIFQMKTIITDKEGKYKIDKEVEYNLTSTLTGVYAQISHPLYDGKTEQIWTWDNKRNDSGVGTKQSDGTIRYDIKLVGVEEKYKNDYDKLNDIPRPYSLVNFINSQNSQYLMDLKRQYSLRYDLDFIMKRWEEIGTKIYKEKAKESWFQDVINKFKKEFKELKQEGY